MVFIISQKAKHKRLAFSFILQIIGFYDIMKEKMENK